MSVTFDPPFMPLQTAAVVIASYGAAIWLLSRSAEAKGVRRLTLIGLRSLVICALGFILMNPVVVAGHAAPAGKPPLILLVDTSRSMRVTDAEGGRTRFDAALAGTVRDSGLMSRLGESYDVRVFVFDKRPLAQSANALSALKSPQGDRTNLGAALADSAPPAAGSRAILVSDGKDTADSFPLDAARALKARGIAIDTVCIGRKSEQKDVEVVARRSQVYAAPAQTASIGAEVRSRGLRTGSATVRLLESGRQIGTKTVPLSAGRADVSFPLAKPKRGTYPLTLAVDAAAGERNTGNNRAAVSFEVIDTHARVLFLEGRPSWDSKFVAQALRADPSISLDVVYKLTNDKFFAVLSEGQKQAGVSVPRTVDQFGRYDVILFGKGYEEFFDETGTTALKEWVSERGGCVVFLRGRPDERTSSLRELEPVNWTGQEMDQLRMRLTEEGRTHPGFAFDAREDAQTVVRKMPPLISASRVQGEKTLAVVLARAEDAPDSTAREMATLAYLRYGQGKSLAIAGQGMWRWAFLPPDLSNYGKVFQEFWTQVIRWMVSDSDFLPGQRIAIRPDRSVYGPGGQVTLLGYLRDKRAAPPAAISVTLPDGKRTAVATARSDGKLADFTAAIRPKGAGEYRAAAQTGSGDAANASCTFVVNDYDAEDADTSADPEMMRQIAAAGGGSAMSLKDLAALPDRLKADRLAREQRPEPKTAWDRPWVLAALLVAAGLEWWLRRRWGLA